MRHEIPGMKSRVFSAATAQPPRQSMRQEYHDVQMFNLRLAIAICAHVALLL
jgi:hypothetical protein